MLEAEQIRIVAHLLKSEVGKLFDGAHLGPELCEGQGAFSRQVGELVGTSEIRQ